MRLAHTLLAVSLLGSATCTGGDDNTADDDGGGGGGGTAPAIVGVWQYQQGSFSFVNCYVSSTTVELTRSGFQIVDQAGTLIRINPDGCRFTIVPTTERHATGVAGEACTTQGTDIYGHPLQTRFEVKSLLLELDPGDGNEMIEVFSLDSRQTSSLGTVQCEISGNNSLDRAP